MRTSFTALILFSASLLVGQSIFEIDKVFFPEEVFVASDFNDSSGIAITASGRIFRINSVPELTELTDFFSAYSNSTFTDVQIIHDDLFFVATESDSLLKFSNGVVEVMGASKGLPAAKFISFVSGNKYVKVSTENGIYTSTDPFLEFTTNVANWEVKILSRNHASTETLMVPRNSSCINAIENTKVVHNTNRGIYEGVFLTTPDFKSSEIVQDAIIIHYQTGYYDFQRAQNFYGSNYGLKRHLGSCSSTVETLIDNVQVNDLILYGWYRDLNIPRMILTATDNGLYITDNIEYDSDFETVLFQELGNIKVNHLAMTNLHCDLSIWASTENGLVKLKDVVSTPMYTKAIGQFAEKKLCEGTNYRESPISSTYFQYQWYKDGNPILDANYYYYDVTEPGFYQLHYWNCHEDITLDVADYTVDDYVESEFDYPDYVEICGNQGYRFQLPNVPNSSIQWYLDDEPIPNQTKRFLDPQVSGVYKYQATNCNGFKEFSKSVNFVKIEYPNFITNLDQKFCSGDTIRLEGMDKGYNIKWISSGGTPFSAFENKNYFIVYDNQIPASVSYQNQGCATTQSISSLSVYPRIPLKTWEDTVVMCLNDQILLRASALQEHKVYWSDGKFGLTRYANEPGMYYVYAEDLNGCKSTVDSIYVKGVPFDTELDWNDTTVLINESILLPAPDGYSYQWQDELSSTNEAVVSFSNAGRYEIFVEISNEEGCSATRYFTINVQGPLSTNGADFQKLFPNPATDFIVLPVTRSTTFQIFNISGELIDEGFINPDRNIIDISKIKAGLHFIRYEGKDYKFLKIL